MAWKFICLPPAMQMLMSTILSFERSAAEVANIFKLEI